MHFILVTNAFLKRIMYYGRIMRKSVAALMAFMIFTLSLACTMPVCPAMAQNAKSTQNSATPPCHGEKSSDQDQNGSPMLSSDCLGVDLFHADTSVDLTPDLTIDHIDFAWADLTTTYDLRPENANVIRGPPFSDPPHFSNSSLYLTTQRLRI
jgi:hypothetical protein